MSEEIMQIKIPITYQAIVRLDGYRAPFLCKVREEMAFDARELDGADAPVVLKFKPDEPTGSQRMRSVRKSHGQFYAKLYDWNSKKGKSDDDVWTLGAFLATPNLFSGSHKILDKTAGFPHVVNVAGAHFSLPTVSAEAVAEWHDTVERDEARAKAAIVAAAVVQIDGERWYRCHEPVLSVRFDGWKRRVDQLDGIFVHQPQVDIDFSHVDLSSPFRDYRGSCRLSVNDTDVMEHHGVQLSKRELDVIDRDAFSFDSRLEAIVKFANMIVVNARGVDRKAAEAEPLWHATKQAVKAAMERGEGRAAELVDMTMQLRERFPQTAGDRTDSWETRKLVDFITATDEAMMRPSTQTSPRAAL
jgi:hypothetical protein